MFDIDIRYVDVLMIGVCYLNLYNSESTTTLIIDLACESYVHYNVKSCLSFVPN